MPPKRPTTTPSSSTPSTPSSLRSPPSTSTTTTSSTSAPASSLTKPNPRQSQTQKQSSQDILMKTWDNYATSTPQRTKLVDAFMGFLVVVGGLQFLYCVIVGNYPFNAFLSGFSATVGQFVLTASLRIQTNPENKTEFRSVSHERAFADFVLGSLILHFFCVNFIN